MLNVGTLAGGIAGNVVSARAEACVFIRLVGPSEGALATLDRIVGEDPLLSYEVTTASEPVTCYTLDGFESKPVAFGSDIPALAGFGDPLLVGPGSIHDAHTNEEKINKGQLSEGVDVYRRVIRRLLEIS
jgi:acetylornithine deacetylase